MASSTHAGALTPELLLRAYAAGFFPMAESADDPEIFWVEPQSRGVFPLDGLMVSRSLAKAVRSERFEIRTDADFDAVIDGCAAASPARPSTWINGTIRNLYRALFDAGFVHTVEAYREGRLVGGLYGLSLGAAFFGESMFHHETDASKVALVHLAARLHRGRYTLLDAQFVTPHLATLGAVEVPRRHYLKLLSQAVAQQGAFPAGHERMTGPEALDHVERAAKDGGHASDV